MPTDAQTARELARRLITRASVHAEGSNGNALAVYAASEFACRELSRSLGATGFGTLLRRALAQSELQHPLLKEIHVGREADPVLSDVTGLIQRHSEAAVIAGLESMLETLFALLGRLIGDDMVPRLVEPERLVRTTAAEDGK